MIMAKVGSKFVSASMLGKWTRVKSHELFRNSATILAKWFPALWTTLQLCVTYVANDVTIWTLVDWWRLGQLQANWALQVFFQIDGSKFFFKTFCHVDSKIDTFFAPVCNFCQR
jgi:hypothetical protein